MSAKDRNVAKQPLVRLLALLAVLPALTACSAGLAVDDDSVELAAAPLILGECPRPGAEPEGSADDPFSTIPSGSLPVGFAPTRVIRCDLSGFGSDGPDLAYTISAKEGQVTAALTKSLPLSDQRFAKFAEGVCTTDLVIYPLVILADGGDHAYRPHLPLDACGKLRPEVQRAVDGLSLTETSSYVFKVRQA